MIKASDLEIGDVVRIREWDDMVEEYEASGGDIYIDAEDYIGFFPEMKYLCGTTFQVKGISHISNNTFRVLGHKAAEEHRWIITPGMVEIVDNNEMEIDSTNIDGFLSSFKTIK